MRKLRFIFLCFIFLSSLQLYAQIWSNAKKLTWNTGDSISPFITTGLSNMVHVVWSDETFGDEIVYKQSTDGGATWSGLKRLTWNSGGSWDPALAVDSSNGIYVVWFDNTPGNYEIFYKQSTNSGATWSGSTRLTWNSGQSSEPAIAIDSGSGIHIVWSDWISVTNEILYKHSSDGGANWSGPARLSWNWGESENPSIATDLSNKVHVVWSDETFGHEIIYKQSTDKGATWSGLKRLTWNSGVSYRAVISVDSSNGIHVVWTDNTPGNGEIFYKRSTDGGISWSGPKRLTWNSGDSLDPALAVDSSDGIHVVWADKTPGDPEIFYKQSTDRGVTWSGFTRLTWMADWSWHSSISIDLNDGIHVVWADEFPGNWEIFYKNRKFKGVLF